MNEFEKINSFMEGELDSSEEHELFNNLAVNDALRSEFKNLLAITAVVNNNRKAFTKNENTKKAVFAALGLSVPLADTVTGGVISGGAGAAAGYGIKSLLATGVLSAVVTAVLLYSFGDFNQTKQIAINQTPQSLVVEMPAPTVNSTPIVSSKEVKINANNLDSKFKTMFENAIVENNNLRKEIGELNSKLNEKDRLISQRTSDLEQKTLAYNSLNASLDDNKNKYDDLLTTYQNQSAQLESLNQELMGTREKINVNPNISSNLISSNNQVVRNASSWSAEWKGSQTYNSNTVDFANSNVSQFNNNSLSILYNFENGFSVGSELRQETFLLEFTGKDVNNIMYLYRQEPNFTTLSLLGRYTYDLSETFDPFAQLTFGGNKIGVVGRLMGGFMYSPYQNLNLIFGLEYNNMSFQYQGNRFNSGKLGINYGVSFTF